MNWLPLKILDSSLSATALCMIGPFLICLLLMTVLDTLQNFELFLVGVVIICFTLGPPTSRR